MIAPEARPKIVLHIGQGKTGTSALPSALARNHELLKSAGVLYPDHPSAAQARAGHVMSGKLAEWRAAGDAGASQTEG
jgi:hypothetical protein